MARHLVSGLSQGPSFARLQLLYEQTSLELTAIVSGLREAFSVLGSGGQWGREVEEEVRVKSERAGRGEGVGGREEIPEYCGWDHVSHK